MSKIGGYQIIDFGGFDLDTITEPLINKGVVLKTSVKGLSSCKRVIFSGLIKSGVQLNDFEVTISEVDGLRYKVYVLGYVFTLFTISNFDYCDVMKEAEPEPIPPTVISYKMIVPNPNADTGTLSVLQSEVADVITEYYQPGGSLNDMIQTDFVIFVRYPSTLAVVPCRLTEVTFRGGFSATFKGGTISFTITDTESNQVTITTLE